MRIVNGCILLLAAISITFAAVSGAYHLDMQQLLALILRQENVPVQEQIVFWQIRVPRILAALLLGAALAGAGTTYQGMLRNPLVSPDILGVSAVPDLVPARQFCGDYPLFTSSCTHFAAG